MLLYSACISHAGPHADPSPKVWKQRTRLAMHGLQSWYNPTSGLYDTTGWWNSANALTTLADYSRSTRDKSYLGVFPNTLVAAQKKFPGFLNNFYDDEGWWALAWIDVYDLTRDQRYLGAAEAIFADMAGGWDQTCGGGIWWSKDRKYKNAIANELFLSVAAHLALRVTDHQARQRYSSWADREWAWFEASTMIDSDSQINDGLDSKCTNNHKTKWTYNQGVILGGLTALSKLHHDHAPVEQAMGIARATLASPSLVSGSHILHEPCEPDCQGDGTQFKGIFIRNLRELQLYQPVPGAPEFIRLNAQSLWSQAREPDYHITVNWSEATGTPDASTQSSALDALTSAWMLSR